MVERITIDSSVIVAALLEKEKKHQECKSLLEKVKNGKIYRHRAVYRFS